MSHIRRGLDCKDHCLQVKMSNLGQIWLESAVKCPGLHMFRDETLCSQHMQTETFSGWTQVLMDFHGTL